MPLVPLALQNFPLALFTLPFYKRNNKYQGVVFDYVTKQKVDRVLVFLIDANTGRVIARTVTNRDGKYGFLISQSGQYELKIKKGAYTLKTDLEKDDLYGKLYTGAKELNEGTVMELNLALIQNSVDWHDYVQNTVSKGKILWRKIWHFLSMILLLGGSYLAIVNVVQTPSTWNYGMIGLYILMIVRLVIIKVTNPRGSVRRKEDNKPLPFSLVELYKDGQRKYFTTTDIQGRYFLQAEKGHYELKVQGRAMDGTGIVKRMKVFLKKGVVKLDVRV